MKRPRDVRGLSCSSGMLFATTCGLQAQPISVLQHGERTSLFLLSTTLPMYVEPKCPIHALGTSCMDAAWLMHMDAVGGSSCCGARRTPVPLTASVWRQVQAQRAVTGLS